MVKALSPFLHTATILEILHIAQVYTRVYTGLEKEILKYRQSVCLKLVCRYSPLTYSTPVWQNPACFLKVNVYKYKCGLYKLRDFVNLEELKI